MSLEELEKEISSAARKKAAEIEAQASEESSRIISDAKAKAAMLLARERDELERQYAEQLSEAKSSMQMLAVAEASRSIAAVAGKYYRKLYLATEKKVRKSYGKLMASALKDAEPLFRGTGIEVIAEAGGRAYAELKKTKYLLRKSKADGLLLRSKDGSITIDSTIGSVLESRSELMRNLLKVHLRVRAGKLLAQLQEGSSKPELVQAKRKHMEKASRSPRRAKTKKAARSRKR